jgi:hypothetical protein
MALKLKLMYNDPDNFNGIEIVEEQSNLGSGNSLYIQGPYTGTALNKNKRVYPKDELDRDIARYLMEMVEPKRAMGELNHSQCITDSASILCEDGWKNVVDVGEDEIIYSLNPDTRVMESHKISRKITLPYKGVMYRVKGRNINTLVTPTHRFPLFSRYGRFELVEIESIYHNRKKYNKHYIPKTAVFISDNEDEYFTLNGYPSVLKRGNYNIDPSSSSKIPMSTFVKFLGIWLAEGHTSGKTTVAITQKKESVKTQIRALLKEFPAEMEWKEYTNDDQATTFALLDYRLNRYLKENFGTLCYNKKIFKPFKNLHPELLTELLYYFNLGDGRFNTVTQGEHAYSIKNVFTTSPQLILDLNEILVKSGGCGNILEYNATSDVMIRGRVVKHENTVPLYHLNLAKTENVWLDDRFLTIEPEYYEGDVYCVTVEHGNFYCMDNGKSHWTGNCAEVNPERACHLVTQLTEDNGVWYGKSKILSGEGLPCGNLVKGLINNGVALGISTRSLGTLEESSGHMTVKNLHIVAFDCVADPSYPKAFVNGILESREWTVNDDGVYEPIYEDFAKALRNIPKKEADTYLREQIIKFVNALG